MISEVESVSLGSAEAEEEVNPQIVEQYLPLVRRVLNRIGRSLPPSVDQEELYSVGVVGLLAASKRYSADCEKTFESYAMMRVRGSMLDELRRLDSLPRTARAKARRVEEKIRELEQKLGRAPNDEELREALGIDRVLFRKLMRQVRPVTFVSLDRQISAGEDSESVDLHDAIPDETEELGWERIERREMIDLIAERLRELPERQQKILGMYYYEGMRLAEIAEIFGLTEARICQIHAQAIRQLRGLISAGMYS